MRNASRLRNPRAFYLTICSGKGGVGKSTIAVMLAARFAECGLRCLLIDADTGLGDLTTFTNAITRRGFERLLLGESRLDDAVTKISPNLWLIGTQPGHPAIEGISAEGLGICREIDGLFDFVIIDTPSSLAPLTLNLVAGADLHLVVTTPKIPSVADSYIQVKQARELDSRSTAVIVNRADSETEGEQAAIKFAELIEKFLGKAITSLGVFTESALLARASENQSLVSFSAADAATVRKLDRITKTITEQDMRRLRRDASLWDRLAAQLRINSPSAFADTAVIA